MSLSADELAALSARAYAHMEPWSARAFAGTLEQPGHLLVGEAGGFVLGMVVLDEAEILALATDPAVQRQGLGRRLLATFEQEAAARGATQVFLEVAAANAPALGFYEACGYRVTGRRKAYYRHADGSRDDALLMCRALT
ncbi:ribosomal protein S18-alanine N-acetyltransferase [Salipiger mangrovisoli]|uniref:ribosomal protein S18-alanine N-acetyltransferase n=1 Tax=Salipiger mangrovisoli TaxID=2865933 RepID=UPI0030B853DB